MSPLSACVAAPACLSLFHSHSADWKSGVYVCLCVKLDLADPNVKAALIDILTSAMDQKTLYNVKRE